MTHQRIVWTDSALECRSYMKRLTLTICTVLAALALSLAHGQSSSSLDEARVVAVHQAVLALDEHLDQPKMERGGLDAAVFTVFAWQQARTPEEDAKVVAIGREKLAAIRRMAAWYPSKIGIAKSADELIALNAAGRKAAVIGLLNATQLGRALVTRLHDLGVIIDVSQLSSAAFEQTVARSRAPVVASHSAVRALPKATVVDLVDTIDYVVKLVGVAHVGISSDFEHAGGIVGYGNASEAINITRELLRRGYNDVEIGKVWSGNWIRVLREVEKLRGDTSND